MDIVNWAIGLFKNPVFYLALLVLGYFAWNTIRKYLRKVPVINKRNTFLLAVGIGLLLTSGVLTGMGFASMSSGGVTFSAQTTTDYVFNGTALSGTNTDVMGDVRSSEAQMTSDNDVTTGIQTITRMTADGKLPAASYTVSVRLPNDFPDGATPTAVLYSHSAFP